MIFEFFMSQEKKLSVACDSCVKQTTKATSFEFCCILMGIIYEIMEHFVNEKRFQQYITAVVTI